MADVVVVLAATMTAAAVAAMVVVVVVLAVAAVVVVAAAMSIIEVYHCSGQVPKAFLTARVVSGHVLCSRVNVTDYRVESVTMSC